MAHHLNAPHMLRLLMTQKRIFSIDIIRGLCIIAVILLHINLRLHFDQTTMGKNITPAILKLFLWSGYYGVVIFFVLGMA